ncbi:MAG: bifunctional proline dehydrogenase/L-glutamate gamma-semialdehyde dehydrogenase PutA [Rhodospirillales bacterium]
MDDMPSFLGPLPPDDPTRRALRRAYRVDEAKAVAACLAAIDLTPAARARIAAAAQGYVAEARRRRSSFGGIDAFLNEYALSTQEGVVLMCLAEALLRIPDAATADRLIRDKLRDADWQRHLGRSESILVNASTWGLMLTGRVIRLDGGAGDMGGFLNRLVARSGEPIIRQSLVQAMRIMSRQFVMGRTIGEALDRAEEDDHARYRHSFDMLGEAAHTAADAARYLDAYAEAIAAVGARAAGRGPVEAPSISVKLSALHPRYEATQRARVLAELTPRLVSLARLARDAQIGLTVDAEEAARLDLSLEVIERAWADPSLRDWGGFGLAVQAYQRRALPVIDWLAALAQGRRDRLMVRLVKGAYWDSEIKRSQEQGLASYPVFTRKGSTDVSYLACARRMIDAADRLYPQFATHNAHTVAAIAEMSADAPFEYQRLHGMGEALYDQIVGDRPCRVYAPVGSHEDLLPYLVRRLLENGANTSFVNRWIDDDVPVSAVVADPIARTESLRAAPHPQIPAPLDIAGPERRIARGVDLVDPLALAPFAAALAGVAGDGWTAAPVIDGARVRGTTRAANDPADRRRVIGAVVEGDAETAAVAVRAAAAGQPAWAEFGAERRADVLAAAADILEADMAALVALCIREGGKTVADSVSDVREAIDYCRYYAVRARRDFAPYGLPGPTGESNRLSLHGRGVFACISPWNFPVAIFAGQVAAALAAGNAVVAKPAEQTPLCAAAVVARLHRAGVPAGALHLVPGDGKVGAALVADPGVAGVAFTGSVEVGRAIARALAARDGPIAPLIAETGGQNAMIVDSSALPEQVVTDVVTSAFLSAGQRCSALRVLFLQDEVADRTLAMLTGAMEELAVGDPALLATDVGPVIDDDAREALARHAGRMEREGRLLRRARLPGATEHGTFFAPVVFEIDRLDRLTGEVFGPVLHVIRYDADRLDDVLAAVKSTGYGLTLGIHSRIDSTVEAVRRALPVGNVYVNRSMVGAVVGMQPFGGEGLSGTGPKAGGPHYLPRFAVERTVSINTTATGGNTQLLSLAEE